MKSTCQIVALFGLILTSAPAFAIPLLAENAAQNVGEALTLYPDSVDPNLFYFMPNNRLSPEKPALSFPCSASPTGASPPEVRSLKLERS